MYNAAVGLYQTAADVSALIQESISKALTAAEDYVDQVAEELRKTISSAISDLQNGLKAVNTSISGIMETATKESSAWRDAVTGIWTKLESWLVERIVGILLAGMDMEVEEMKKNGRT